MTIPASIPAALPDGSAESKPAGPADAAPAGFFDSLLPAEPAAPKPDAGEREPEDSKEDEDKKPTQAEQTNLAALLCALAALPQDATPVAPEPTLAGATAGEPVPAQAAPGVAANSAAPQNAAPLADENPEATLAALPGVASDPNEASSAANPDDSLAAAANDPENNERGMAVAKADPAMNQTVIQDQTASPTMSAAGLNSAAAVSGKEVAGPSAGEMLAAKVAARAAGQKVIVSKGRETAEAKPVRGAVEAPAARSSARSSAAPFGDQSSKQSQGDAQTALSADNEQPVRGNGEDFSATMQGSFTPADRVADASRAAASAAAPKPVSTAAMLEEVGLGLERMQQRGSDRVDLSVALEGGGQVSIQLQMRDGAAHVTFHSGSDELRTALEQGWARLSSRSEAAGLPLTPPVFKAPQTSSNAGQQEFRERRQEPQQERHSSSASYAAPNLPFRRTPVKAPARTSSSGLNLWA